MSKVNTFPILIVIGDRQLGNC